MHTNDMEVVTFFPTAKLTEENVVMQRSLRTPKPHTLLSSVPVQIPNIIASLSIIVAEQSPNSLAFFSLLYRFEREKRKPPEPDSSSELA